MTQLNESDILVNQTYTVQQVLGWIQSTQTLGLSWPQYHRTLHRCNSIFNCPSFVYISTVLLHYCFTFELHYCTTHLHFNCILAQLVYISTALLVHRVTAIQRCATSGCVIPSLSCYALVSYCIILSHYPIIYFY